MKVTFPVATLNNSVCYPIPVITLASRLLYRLYRFIYTACSGDYEGVN